MKTRYLIFSLLSGVALAVALFGSCSSTEFGGLSGKKKSSKDKPATDADDDDDGDTQHPDDEVVVDGFDTGRPNLEEAQDDDAPVRIFDDEFFGGNLVKPLEPEQKGRIWVATQAGYAYYLRLEGSAVVETKRWTGLVGGDGGARTYVTEGGLVVARSGGRMFFIDPASAEGPVTNTHVIPGVSNDQRGCVVSYRRDKRRYIGVGYGAGKYMEFELESTPPYAPKWGSGTAAQVSTPKWGYSCFIDQKQLVYYSDFHNGPRALNLRTKQEVPATSAPNGAFTSANIASATVGPKRNASYAISGDGGGNVLNGDGFYTFTHDAKTKTIWGTGTGGGMLSVYPDKCFSTEANCSGFASYNTVQINANPRPISALGDGKVVGIQRGGNGQVYVMSLKNPKDATQGIDAVRVAEVEGDPYMYTDFTGATLYMTKSETTFELEGSDGFDAGKQNGAVGFSWAPRAGGSKEWRDLSLAVRCYKAGGDKGSYDNVSTVRDSPKMTIVQTGGCQGKKYDRVDVRIRQKNDGDSLMDIRKIQVTVFQ